MKLFQRRLQSIVRVLHFSQITFFTVYPEQKSDPDCHGVTKFIHKQLKTRCEQLLVDQAVKVEIENRH